MKTHSKVDLNQRKKHKISQTYDANTNRIFWNSEKVKDALGYPVTKTIFDTNGDIILDVGDLVTHRAIQRAKEAGVLAQVLRAIYKSNSTLNYYLE